MDLDDRELDQLWAEYRKACPEPEVSADFIPGMWSRIDARRGFALTLRRLTRAFVTAAAAICVAMGVYMATPHYDDSPVYTTTYVDTLEASPTFETIAYAELDAADLP